MRARASFPYRISTMWSMASRQCWVGSYPAFGLGRSDVLQSLSICSRWSASARHDRAISRMLCRCASEIACFAISSHSSARRRYSATVCIPGASRPQSAAALGWAHQCRNRAAQDGRMGRIGIYSTPPLPRHPPARLYPRFGAQKACCSQLRRGVPNLTGTPPWSSRRERRLL